MKALILFLLTLIVLSCDNPNKKTNNVDTLMKMNPNKNNVEFLYKIPWKKDGLTGHFLEPISFSIITDLPPIKIRASIKLRFFDEKLYLWEEQDRRIYTVDNNGNLEFFFEIPKPKGPIQYSGIIDFIIVDHQKVFSIDLLKRGQQRFNQLSGFNVNDQRPIFLLEEPVERALYSTSGDDTHFKTFLRDEEKILVQELEKNVTTVYKLIMATGKIEKTHRFKDVKRRIFHQKDTFGFVTETQDKNQRRRIWQVPAVQKEQTPTFNATAFPFLANPIQMDKDKNVYGVKPFEIAKINPQNEIIAQVNLQNVIIKDNEIWTCHYDTMNNQFSVYNKNGASEIEINIPTEIAQDYTRIQLIEVDNLNQMHFIMYKKRQPYKLILSKNKVLEVIKTDYEMISKYPRVQSTFSWAVDVVKSKVLIPIQTEKGLYIGSIQL